MEQTLSYHLVRLYKDFLSFTTKELKELGLNYGQLPFILYIGKHPGCTQAELTNGLKIDWGYSQRSITKLIDSHFIVKNYLDGDNRTGHLTLTVSGDLAFTVSHKVFSLWDQMHLKDFTPEEKETLLSLLMKISVKEYE